MRWPGNSGRKQRAILDEVRMGIVGGQWQPGQRLPSNREMQAEYGVTGVTVGRALRKLIDAGFLVSAERSGVYVAAEPPHAHRYGVVFEGDPVDGAGWYRFHEALRRAAIRGVPGLSCEFVPYYRIRGHDPGHGDWPALIRDTAEWRVGGLLFANDPWRLYGMPPMHVSGMPRVAAMAPKDDRALHTIRFDTTHGLAQAALRRHGCRRMAVIASSTVCGNDGWFRNLVTSFGAEGIEIPAPWVQFADLARPRTAFHTARLLLDRPPEHRPDALFVADDNFLEAVEAGVVETSLSVPGDLVLLALVNFPSPAEPRLPVERFGFDLRELLAQAVEIFRNRPGADAPLQHRLLAAVTESEFLHRWEPAELAAPIGEFSRDEADPSGGAQGVSGG